MNSQRISSVKKTVFMPSRKLLVVVLAVLQIHYTASADLLNYMTQGPCTINKLHLDPMLLPQESGCGYYCTVHPRVHVPGPSNAVAGSLLAGTRCSTAPYPVVVFFSGFQLSSSYYTVYARRLASWGFAVVQYDLTLLHIVHDDLEEGYLAYLLDHLAQLPATAGVLDLTRMGTAGHSRGGKLAAVHLAGYPNVLTAFMVDPVDSTPSAVDVLRGKGKTAAIAAAGISGPCNPVARNYHDFYDTLSAGSWLEVVPSAGHMQFANVSSDIIARTLDWICHSGHASHEHVIQLTTPALVAWMDVSLRKVQPAGLPLAGLSAFKRLQLAPNRQLQMQAMYQENSSLLQAFFDWVQQQQQAGEITFEVKQPDQAVTGVDRGGLA